MWTKVLFLACEFFQMRFLCNGFSGFGQPEVTLYSCLLKGSFTQNENSVIIYWLSCHTKPFFLLQNSKNDILKNVINQTVPVTIDFHSMGKKHRSISQNIFFFLQSCKNGFMIRLTFSRYSLSLGKERYHLMPSYPAYIKNIKKIFKPLGND